MIGAYCIPRPAVNGKRSKKMQTVKLIVELKEENEVKTKDQESDDRTEKQIFILT